MIETSSQQPAGGDFNGRHSASPARTIDSHDSTTGSMDTIVDRSLNREELHQVVTTIEQSTNTTNTTGSGSLTNSQIGMLQRDEQRKQHDDPDQDQARQDAQSHIYSSPVYDEKPPALKVNATKSPANTLDSRISRKQRCPPEFIKYKEGSEGGGSASSSLSSKDRRKRKASNECCSAFPLQIVLGTLQLLLAISLVALGSLLIVREAALSMAGCGIWTGLIAAVTGSLGVVSMRKTQTAFLALSLVCIASSTLALAISGVGLSRDLNRMAEQKGEQLDLINTNSEVSAACGLIFALFLHFVVSIVSVYRCALQICTK
ncbi:hypothetical protein M5D96_013729 [Drosophila gunungcola]|uniref:Uncharacterized protein n=1 Tax=Drosophila gunungcola TaxID=103775 RepID=A0A9Q0BI50_9MUSC|nr:hypothetical protein M5D96_013729 [Drosophila gunungcola]